MRFLENLKAKRAAKKAQKKYDLELTEWAFSKILSVAKTETGDDFLIGVSNRKKTSGLRFSPSDAQFFSRIFAMAQKKIAPHKIASSNTKLEIHVCKPLNQYFQGRQLQYYNYL